MSNAKRSSNLVLSYSRVTKLSYQSAVLSEPEQRRRAKDLAEVEPLAGAPYRERGTLARISSDKTFIRHDVSFGGSVGQRRLFSDSCNPLSFSDCRKKLWSEFHSDLSAVLQLLADVPHRESPAIKIGGKDNSRKNQLIFHH
jgi:hypothetical protein